MTDKIVRVKLISGEPLLGKAEIADTLNIELVVPGVEDGLIKVSACENELYVSLQEEVPYCETFEVAFISDFVDFRDHSIEKDNGVLYIKCRLKDENENEPIEFLV